MAAPLKAVVDTWQDLRAASSRTRKRDRLARLFEALEDPDELRLAALYLSGELGVPPLGAGGALVREAHEAAPAETVPPPLELREVDATFAALGPIAGEGSKGKRVALLAGLLARGDAAEREFLCSLVVGELRQGALETLVTEGLARALGLDLKALRRAVMLAGSLGDVTRAARREGAAALARFELTLLVPVEPMLAGTAGPLGETLAALGGEAAAEWKLDGIRVQAHRSGDDVRVFSRNLRDITAEAPGIVAAARALPAERVVLDGESVPGGAMFFDVLYLDDRPLVDRPDRERRATLERLLPPGLLVPRRLVRTAAEAEAALDDALAHGHEGLLLKALDAPYVAGRRGTKWRKLKPVVTVDLVVLGAEWGSGRRQGWLSNLHLGARDAADPTRFWMIGKTFKGLTDAMLRELTEALPPLMTEQRGHVVKVRPARVVEVALEGVFRSTRYEGGLALRFARVKRFRPDKRPADATTLDEVAALAEGP